MEHAAQLAARYAEISEGGKEVHKLLLSSNRVLKVSKGAPIWKAYVEFMNDILIDGLARTVANSLKYLNDQQDPQQIHENETAPLLEVQLELLRQRCTTSPSCPTTRPRARRSGSLATLGSRASSSSARWPRGSTARRAPSSPRWRRTSR